jgi:YVTN family beta-propeller protein
MYDPASDRVFVMDAGANEITVIDPAAAKVTGTIALPGAPECTAVDGAGHLFVNLEDKSQVVSIDTKALKIDNVWPLAPGEGPTGLAIDVAGHHLFAGCANKKMIVLDDRRGKILADLPIGAHVDAARFDPGTGYAFASNGDGTLTIVAADGSGQFKVLDTVSTKVGARTMELDPKTHAVYLVTSDFGPPDETTHGRPKPLPGTFVVLKFTK